jgi:hypothetical protein
MLNNARGCKVLKLVVFFSIFSCCTKSGDQEGLSRFGYKTNREGKNLGILLHVSEPLEPIS